LTSEHQDVVAAALAVELRRAEGVADTDLKWKLADAPRAANFDLPSDEVITPHNPSRLEAGFTNMIF
jgi:hypothetical protein